MAEDTERFATFSIGGENSILVVDDEESILKLLTRYLTKLGYRVATASDGEEGLARIKEQSFDCAIIDLNMPRLPGDELLKEIKKLSPRTEVIIITGYATIETAVKCLGKLGAYDLITKPLHPITAVGPVVQKALERRSLYMENQRLISEQKELNAQLERKVQEKTAALEDAYENLALSYNELNHYISALININQLLLSITWSTDLDFIIENVLHYAMSITDSGNALFVRIDKDGKIVQCAFAAKEIEGLNLKKGGTLPDCMAPIAGLSRDITMNSPEGELPFARFQGVPLRKGEKATGLLAVFNKEQDYTPRDSEILSYLANGASVALLHGALTGKLGK